MNYNSLLQTTTECGIYKSIFILSDVMKVMQFIFKIIYIYTHIHILSTWEICFLAQHMLHGTSLQFTNLL